MLKTIIHQRLAMRVFVTLVALGLLGSGCSGGDTTPQATTIPTTSTTSSNPTTTTAVVPTTVGPGGTAVAVVAASVEKQFQDEWDYYPAEKPSGVVGPVDITCDRQGEVGFGDVLACEATPREYREYYPDPLAILILVTGEDGSAVHRRAYGLEAAYQTVGGGLFCRDLIDEESYYFSYFGAVAYWFWEGQPDRMDEDKDGIPCESVYSLPDMASFWAETPREETTDIHFGYITDLSTTGPPYELSIDYATMLSGLEANLAAEAAGEIQPGEGVPNDFFISNQNPRLRTFELSTDVELSLMASGQDGIASIPVDPNLWVVLFEAAGRCAAADWPSECADLGGEEWIWFGRRYLPYWIQLDGDSIVRIEEQYLP